MPKQQIYIAPNSTIEFTNIPAVIITEHDYTSTWTHTKTGWASKGQISKDTSCNEGPHG